MVEEFGEESGGQLDALIPGYGLGNLRGNSMVYELMIMYSMN